MIKGEAMRAGKGAGTLSPPVHVRLMGEINNVSISIKRLFAYRYQVLPYECSGIYQPRSSNLRLVAAAAIAEQLADNLTQRRQPPLTLTAAACAH